MMYLHFLEYQAVFFFGEWSDLKKSLPESGLEGVSFSGKLPTHNCNLITAKPKLNEEKSTWFYIKQGKSSAFSTQKTTQQTKINPYKKLFKQGAIIVPRTFYFVQLTQDTPPDWKDRNINIKTSNEIQNDAKKPWNGLKFSGQIESDFIFRTALAKSILPFSLYEPDLIVLPITIETNNANEKEIKLHTEKKLSQEGYMYASKWFQNAENIWKIHRTEINRKYSSEQYLNYQNKLTAQNLNAPYLVLYNASAKDANATVVKRKNLDLEFIAESKGYFYYTDNLKEAYYLTAILNSITPNLMIKDFQARGLFGARHVHKKILDIYFPKFNEKNKKHERIAKLSKNAHLIVSKFLKTIDKTKKVEGLQLGKIRLDIKKHLTKEMKEIYNLVKQIIG